MMTEGASDPREAANVREKIRLADELAAGRSVITFTSGSSMEPLLHDKRKKRATHVLIRPASGEPAVGDMPLMRRSDGSYMLHRLVGIERSGGAFYYVTRGDNCVRSERFPSEALVGVVTEIYRGEKTIRVTDAGYKFYVRVWMATYPVRKIFLRARGLAARALTVLKNHGRG